MSRRLAGHISDTQFGAARTTSRTGHGTSPSPHGIGARPAKDRRRVLVIDDDGDLRELLSAVLKSEGYEVFTAENGAAALSVLRTMVPDVIVLDLMMPVMNGWQFREAQSAIPQYARIPTICLSGYHQARHQAAALGMSACVQKPFEVDDLVEIVNGFFRNE
jgi:CheY-like chemotaxis protein